ncbi:uncharacterized protein LOC116124385 [Pistacia vera]|uniref:uncharacterized protein LOC116124385 n=1 Tax=Pistacia vera TaxID=55513 RepID=UPI001263A286|nr:uncharacterized protein LOC116124385 [Pistacia vera]
MQQNSNKVAALEAENTAIRTENASIRAENQSLKEKWYTNLPNGSIDSFEQLTNTFVEQFASSKKLKKLSVDLYKVYQRRGELLREYVSRFNKEKISIPFYNPETTVDAFRKVLLSDGEFYKEVTKLGYTTMEDALARAVIQIRWEEDEMNRAVHARYDPRRNDKRL